MNSLEFPSSGNDIERQLDPEIAEVLEFIRIYEEIQKLIAWLIEASANTDISVKAIRRVRLLQLIQKLGLDPDDPNTFLTLEQLKHEITDRALRPKPRIKVPEVGFFKSRIQDLINEQTTHGNSIPFYSATEQNTNLISIAQHGHTNWSTVQSRVNSKDISEWIHGIATIMADPIAYHVRFASLTSEEASDHLELDKDWSIQNGRHRALAVRSLGEDYIAESGMSNWIPVIIEK